MARHLRQFGVPPVDLSPAFDAWGRLQSVELPLPESQNAARKIAREEAEKYAIAEAAREKTVDTQWQSEFSFGAVVKPMDNTLRGEKYVLRQAGGINTLEFNPHIYGVFDGIIVKKCGVDAAGNSLTPAFNDAEPNYTDFAPLRRNLAILRNYILSSRMFPDGKFLPHENASGDSEDKKNLDQVREMAAKLGAALAGPPPPPTLLGRFGVSMGRLLTGKSLSDPNVNAFMKSANVPDLGIQVMYNYLLSLKNKPSFWSSLPFVSSPRKWPLLPVEQTPFSEANMLAYSRGSMMEGCANEFDKIVVQLRSLDVLSDENKKVSVEHAHNILKNLRILLGQGAEEAKLSNIADPKQEEGLMMMRVALAFKDTIGDIARIDPNLLRNPEIAAAVDAIEHISYRVKMEAQIDMAMQGEMVAAKRMGLRAAAMPARFKTEVPLKELVAKLETGLNTAQNIRQTLPARSPDLQQARSAQQSRAAAQTAMQMQAAQSQQRAQAAARRATATAASKDVMARAHVAQVNSQHAAELARQLHQHQEEMQRKQNPNAPLTTPRK